MNGDVLSKPGRFGPLSADHPSVGKDCGICDQPMNVGDVPALVEVEPDDDLQRFKRDRGGAYTATCHITHETCAYA